MREFWSLSKMRIMAIRSFHQFLSKIRDICEQARLDHFGLERPSYLIPASNSYRLTKAHPTWNLEACPASKNFWISNSSKFVTN